MSSPACVMYMYGDVYGVLHCEANAIRFSTPERSLHGFPDEFISSLSARCLANTLAFNLPLLRYFTFTRDTPVSN